MLQKPQHIKFMDGILSGTLVDQSAVDICIRATYSLPRGSSIPPEEVYITKTISISAVAEDGSIDGDGRVARVK